jgi:hypothetical protein
MRIRTAARFLALCLAIVGAMLTSAVAQPAAQTVAQASTTSTAPSAPFDVKAAVDAYLASVPAAARARSDAYFEGGYWLCLTSSSSSSSLLLSSHSPPPACVTKSVSPASSVQMVFTAELPAVLQLPSYLRASFRAPQRLEIDRRMGCRSAHPLVIGLILGGVFVVMLFASCAASNARGGYGAPSSPSSS